MTFLGLYKYLFTTELLVAEWLFTFRLEKRKRFIWRALGGIALCYLLTALFPLFDDKYNGWYVSFMFLVLFAATFGAVAFSYDVPLKNAFFCCLTAYTAQHLSYELFRLGLLPFETLSANDMYGDAPINLAEINYETVLTALAYIDIYIAVYGVAYFVLGKKIGRAGDLNIRNMNMLLLSSMILLVDIILNAFTVYITVDYNIVYDVIIGVYNSLCCVLVFYIQRSIIEAKGMKSELETVSKLLMQSQKQYEMRKEEIDLINIKCHDLKKRIDDYDGAIDHATVEEIKDMICIYDANIKTGNAVVDIILTEKSLACNGKNISLSCMADCSELVFVAEGDLYALFGNIVDNAIEACSRVNDPDKKCVSLNVRSASGCVSVMSENYFDGELRLGEDGLPVTTKANTDYHGFGLKSIKTVAEKYGGSVSVLTEGDIFRINVLLPVPARRTKAE